MFAPLMGPNMLLAIHQAREQELTAKAGYGRWRRLANPVGTLHQFRAGGFGRTAASLLEAGKAPASPRPGSEE